MAVLCGSGVVAATPVRLDLCCERDAERKGDERRSTHLCAARCPCCVAPVPVVRSACRRSPDVRRYRSEILLARSLRTGALVPYARESSRCRPSHGVSRASRNPASSFSGAVVYVSPIAHAVLCVAAVLRHPPRARRPTGFRSDVVCRSGGAAGKLRAERRLLMVPTSSRSPPRACQARAVGLYAALLVRYAPTGVSSICRHRCTRPYVASLLSQARRLLGFCARWCPWATIWTSNTRRVVPDVVQISSRSPFLSSQ
ncbi:hypothetical protein BJ912DRAFT_1009023 [Pholiota molesta]|nr:hypothetical protein BJ912DRAFT_1009023 [Pholiota molesta]